MLELRNARIYTSRVYKTKIIIAMCWKIVYLARYVIEFARLQLVV